MDLSWRAVYFCLVAGCHFANGWIKMGLTLSALIIAISLSLGIHQQLYYYTILFGYVPFIFTPLFALAAPIFIIWSRLKPLTPAPPRFIGIEGSVDIRTVEKYLLGFSFGRMLEVPGPMHYMDSSQSLEPPAPEGAGAIAHSRSSIRARDDPYSVQQLRSRRSLSSYAARKAGCSVRSCARTTTRATLSAARRSCA